MRVTADEVREIKFSVALRGYAPDEVDSFLDVVVDTLSEYEAYRSRSRKRLGELESTINRIVTGQSADDRGDADETVVGVRSMVEEAARVSEQMVEQALEVGEHLLEELRKLLAEADKPGQMPRD